MTPPLTRREFLKATVLLPAIPILDPISIAPRWHGIAVSTITLNESSFLYTGEGVWSEGAEEEGAFDQPREVYAKLTQQERDYLHLNIWDGCVHYDGSWENEGLDELGDRMYELDLPWALSDDWRWLGDWFSS